jgi:hypothetical protein
MRVAPLVRLAAVCVLAACVRLPVRAAPSPDPSADDGVVINTVRRPDDALYRAYRAMVTAGLSVDPAVSGARRLQARAWTVAGDTALAVEASVIETASPQTPTIVVLSATWSSATTRVRNRLLTNREPPTPWAALQRLGASVRDALTL